MLCTYCTSKYRVTQYKNSHLRKIFFRQLSFSQRPSRTIYLGHVNEIRYVSTMCYSSATVEIHVSDSSTKATEQSAFLKKSDTNSTKRKRKANMERVPEKS